MTFVDVLRDQTQRRPDKTAFIFLEDGAAETARVTYAGLEVGARALAALLQQRGLAGQRALLVYPPGLPLINALFGCLFAGVIPVPAYPPDPLRLARTVGRFRALAADARPAVVLTTGAFLPLVEAARRCAPEVASVAWLPTDAHSSDLADRWAPPALAAASPALLQYTSGSTGRPKGVVVSHASLLACQQQIAAAFEHSDALVACGWLPPYHDMGLIGLIMQPPFVGGSCVLMPPEAFLRRPLAWLAAISRYRATTSGGPDFAYDLCVRRRSAASMAELELASWRVAFSGSEPVRADTLERFAGTYGACGFDARAFFPCYGLAEATLIVSGGAVSDPPVLLDVQEESLEQHRAVIAGAAAGRRLTLVGCGRPLGKTTLRVVDPQTGREQPEGRVGELWVAGPTVSAGYWGAAQGKDFDAPLGAGAGAFLRTGDLGFLWQGELFVTGRLQDLLVVEGRARYPHEIERTVESSHPALRPGCSAAFCIAENGRPRLVVVAELERRHRPDRRDGGAGAAAGGFDRRAACDRRVVEALPRHDGVPFVIEDLVRSVREAVAAEHALLLSRLVLITPGAIPKTTSGKVQRQACRAALLSRGLLPLFDTAN